MKQKLNRVFQISSMRMSMLLLPIMVAALFLVGCGAVENGDEQAVPPTVEEMQEQEIASIEDPAETSATMPPPIVAEASNTPVPATNTPEPTATPENTNTPEATEVPPTDTPQPVPPTNTPAPVQPTNPPPPPPTETPPPPPPPQKGANGLVASHFALQDRSDYSAGGKVWYEFTVSNSTGGEVPYNALGVMPKKDGVDRFDWYQQTYGGPNSTIDPGGLTWEDRIELPEAGSYTLRLVMCFDGFDNCLQGGGAWHTLSDEIPVQMN